MFEKYNVPAFFTSKTAVLSAWVVVITYSDSLWVFLSTNVYIYMCRLSL